MNSSNGRPTIRLTPAQALVKYLQVQYSERDGKRHRLIEGAFGIFGHGNVAGLGQALAEFGADLPYFQSCTEQSMVHTASGHAKATLRMSTFACMSSIGTGSTNMVSGAATATINRLPVLLIPADTYATRHRGPVLQQLEHPISADVSVNDCFRPVSRFFDRISRPEHLLTAVPEAMRVLPDPAEHRSSDDRHAARKLMSQADLGICVGTRLAAFATGSHSAFNHPQVKFVGINVCGSDSHKLGALPIIADAREALRALHEAGTEAGISPDASYIDEVDTVKQSWQDLLQTDVFVQHPGEAMSEPHAIHTINEAAQAGDTILTAAGGPSGDLQQLWDTSGGRNCLLEFGYSCMGWEIPAGLGVRMAQEGGEVYVLIRRRYLPDEPDRAGDGDAGGLEDHAAHRRQPRISNHPALALPIRCEFRKRVPGS